MSWGNAWANNMFVNDNAPMSNQKHKHTNFLKAFWSWSFFMHMYSAHSHTLVLSEVLLTIKIKAATGIALWDSISSLPLQEWWQSWRSCCTEVKIAFVLTAVRLIPNGRKYSPHLWHPLCSSVEFECPFFSSANACVEDILAEYIKK